MSEKQILTSNELQLIYQKFIVDILNKENITKYKMNFVENDFKGDNYLGKLISIAIAGKDEHNEDIEMYLILKAAPNSPQVRSKVAIKQFYKTEIYTYKSLLPALEGLQNMSNIPEKDQFKFVHCYRVMPEEPNEFLIMEDLSKQGFKMCPRKNTLDSNHINLIMREIAKFHSLSFALRQLKPDVYKEIAKNVEGNSDYSENIAAFLNSIVKNANYYITNEEYKKKFEKYCRYDLFIKSSQSDVCEPYNVFCHGDFWQNNLLFKYEDDKPIELRMLDWQWVKHCSPIFDIGHLIFCSTDQELRKDHYEEFLNTYYNTLSLRLEELNCNIEKCYPKQIFREQLQTILPNTLILTTMTTTYTTREDEDLIDLETEIQTLIEENDFDFRFRSKISADNFTNRLQNVICDFMKLGVL